MNVLNRMLTHGHMSDEERCRLIMEESACPVLELDLNGLVRGSNLLAKKYLAVEGNRDSQTLEDLFPGAHLSDSLRQAFLGVSSQLEAFVQAPCPRYFDLCFVPVRDAYGDVSRVLAVAEDVTESRCIGSILQQVAQLLCTSADAFVITDAEGQIQEVNSAFGKITGYSMDEVIGKNLFRLHSGLARADLYKSVWRGIKLYKQWTGEVTNRRKDGEVYPENFNLCVISGPSGKPQNFIAVMSDLSEFHGLDSTAWKRANYDYVTGLPNRQLFIERLGQEIKKHRRNGSPVALLLLDLDHFKEVNDTLGHMKGDVLLEEAARRIRKCVRETDTVSRLGGDEFAVILPECALLQVQQLAHDIAETLAQPFELGDGDSSFITTSIGIALYPDNARDINTLVKHADQAMYSAKSEGRNRFHFFLPAMQQEAQTKMKLTNDLRYATQRGELEVHYQPILELVNGRLKKVEALLRWHHPSRGEVGPQVFIPLAEASGLIHDIGNWVSLQVISHIVQWQQRFGQIVQVSVNRSPIQFDQGDTLWLDRLNAVGLPGNCITVEITEGMLLKKSDRIQQSFLDYRNQGVEVSIDDFGTGFSALSYLKQFDIDYLKIDRSFISEIMVDDSDKALTEAIIVMAHKLGIKTIAEGVETQDQHHMLRQFGCDYAQGFWYSRPVGAPIFESILDRTQSGEGNFIFTPGTGFQ
ncbi:MAG: EAL domain-containing protein [Ferrovum sp.]|nr:EAL domain-containing protein [Ferrovum sp.]